jgi:D-3-phosphoglycerate dehydrogenase
MGSFTHSSFTVYVLDPYHPDAIAALQSHPNIKVILPSDPTKDTWHQNADGVIIRSESQLTASDFARAAGKLRVVVKQGVGVDNIDLTAAAANGIAIHNTPALNSEAVAELALGLTLSLSRRVTEVDRRIRGGERVVRSQTLGVSLFQKTVGVIGMGNIGRVVAKKFQGMSECKILGYDPVAPGDAWAGMKYRRVESLEELLRESDVVTLHVPLLASTKGLIGEAQLGIMKDTAILVNCARGGVVDEGALLKALKENSIWGAVLDAVEIEPPTLDTYRAFLELDNVIITPHIGASTIENQSRSGLAVVETLLAVLEGRKDVSGKLV